MPRSGRDMHAKLENEGSPGIRIGLRRRTIQFVSLPSKFALVGVVNTVLDFALFMTLVYFAGLGPTSANIISYTCGILNSFVLNKHWTFKAAGN